MITFTDLVGLMLAFFVMLFSMATLDEAKWRQFAGAPATERDTSSESGNRPATAARNAAPAPPQAGRDLDYLTSLLAGQLAAEPRLAGVILRHRGDRVVISLPDALLFEPDSATPRDTAEGALFALAGVLRNLPNRIEVEGHTDPDPPDRASFASNWELSLERALAVSAGLARAGYGHPVTVRGYGTSRFDALSPRLARSQRYALARRVDVILRGAAEAGS